jgi:FAD binding domain
MINKSPDVLIIGAGPTGLGDAAHIHSPVGGQGMNTGLGDAMNLAWKLSAVVDRRANEDVLATYEPERIAFARKLVATTDRAFQAASSPGRLAEVVRTQIVPRIVPGVIHAKLARRVFFRALSQTGIEYRASPWSGESVGEVRAGDRLPWVAPAKQGEPDNFTPLRSLDWQVHVYGSPPPALRARCDAGRVSLHAIPRASRRPRATGAVSVNGNEVHVAFGMEIAIEPARPAPTAPASVARERRASTAGNGEPTLYGRSNAAFHEPLPPKSPGPRYVPASDSEAQIEPPSGPGIVPSLPARASAPFQVPSTKANRLTS